MTNDQRFMRAAYEQSRDVELVSDEESRQFWGRITKHRRTRYGKRLFGGLLRARHRAVQSALSEPRTNQKCAVRKKVVKRKTVV